MVIRYLKNSLVLSVFFSVLIIYSHSFLFNRLEMWGTIIPHDQIEYITGIVKSSPVKLSNGKYYSCKVKALSFQNKNIESSGFGIITVYIPSSFVESFYPGKLYSTHKKDTFIETGSLIHVKGNVFKNTFYGEEIISSSFETNGKFLCNLRKIRALGRLKFKRMMYSWGDAGGFLLALLSGSREYTSREISDAFKNSGLSHILALSGMHLSMFSGIAFFLGDKIGKKKITLVLRLLSVIFFVWFAGFSPSLLRAFICACILLFQEIISVEKSPMLVILCFSFFVQTLISPTDLFNIGFILSYSALFGILLFGEFFRKLYSFFIPKRIAGSLSASTSAQFFTIPVSACIFKQITPIGIISTLFVSPVVTIFIYSGLAFIILGLLFPGFVSPGGFFINLQYNLIKSLVTFFSKIPFLRFN